MSMHRVGSYPTTRLRRVRQSDWIRRLVSEIHFSCDDLVWPVFVIDQQVGRQPVESMPGVYRLSQEELLKVAQSAVDLGIPSLALFPCLAQEQRDERGSQAVDENGILVRSVRLIKSHFPQLGVMCDVALDPFTSHAHDGLLDTHTGRILNDETVDVLCEQALLQARAGCDVLAPSDMMDGRVGRIRQTLDQHGYTHVCLAPYAVKYASALYKPFRQALFADNLLKSDKKTYQMSFDRRHEALQEAHFDLNEGADLLIIKPSLFYFDILWRIKEELKAPTMIFQVSGEYAMMERSFSDGTLNKDEVLWEYVTSAKRAGADAVITYFAPYIARMMRLLEGRATV